MSRRHDFAPGAIERYSPGWLGTHAQRRELVRWLTNAVLAMAAVGFAALLSGYVVGVYMLWRLS